MFLRRGTPSDTGSERYACRSAAGRRFRLASPARSSAFSVSLNDSSRAFYSLAISTATSSSSVTVVRMHHDILA